MKFLFDQSADFRLIAHLKELGHGVTAISRDYPHSLANEEVLAIAQQVLLVADRDFGELIFYQGLAGPAYIYTESLTFRKINSKSYEFNAPQILALKVSRN